MTSPPRTAHSAAAAPEHLLVFENGATLCGDPLERVDYLSTTPVGGVMRQGTTKHSLNGGPPATALVRGEEQDIRNALTACFVLRGALESLPPTDTLNGLERGLSVVLDSELSRLYHDLFSVYSDFAAWLEE